MLPRRLLRIAGKPDAARPAYLGTADEVWARALQCDLDSLSGEPAHRVTPRLRARVLEIAAQQRVPVRAVEGVLQVLLDERGEAVSAEVAPIAARRAAFEAASAQDRFDRVAALGVAADRLGTTVPLLEAALFADFARERCLGASASPASPRDVIERYHLRLLQGILCRSEDLTVDITSHAHAVVRFAKLSRLICTFEERPGAVRIHVSGPLSLFRFTLKYGRSLARFAPAVLGTPGFELTARARLDDLGTAIVRVASGDPLPIAHALPRDFDSQVERRLVRDFAKLGSAWTLRREGTAIDVGGRTFFPDFVCERGQDRVLLEIVGYYTPDYLAKKLAAIAAVHPRPILVAIDEDLACTADEVRGANLLRYRKRIDACALLAALDDLAGEGTPPDVRSPDHSGTRGI